jgi:hypothetical protein
MPKRTLTLGLPAPLPDNLRYFADKARARADCCRGLGGGGVSLDICRGIVTTHLGGSILIQRDSGHRDGIAGRLQDVMLEAANLDYDLGDYELLGHLATLASELYSGGYQPMRVLGATAEAFKRT